MVLRVKILHPYQIAYKNSFNLHILKILWRDAFSSAACEDFLFQCLYFSFFIISHTIFQISWRKFLFPLSSFTVIDHRKLWISSLWSKKVETVTKNCLNMALYLSQFLRASRIRVLRSIHTELFSRHANFFMLVEEEYQLLQKSKHDLDTRTFQQS